VWLSRGCEPATCFRRGVLECRPVFEALAVKLTLKTRGLLYRQRDESLFPRKDGRSPILHGRDSLLCRGWCRIWAASRVVNWQWHAAPPRWPPVAEGPRSAPFANLNCREQLRALRRFR